MSEQNFSKQDLSNARRQMRKCLKKCPGLTPNGMAVVRYCDTSEDMLKDDLLMQFLLCKEWLERCQVIKTINHRHSSYGYKHFVENWASRYISNGAFIAAAIALNIPMQPIHPTSLNVSLAISEKSVKFMEKQTMEKQAV